MANNLTNPGEPNNGSQVQGQQSSENKITFSIESPDEDGFYHVSFNCPIVGGLTDIRVNSTPETIGLDAIDCIADHLKLFSEMRREKRAKDHNENISKMKVRDLSMYRDVCDCALYVYDGKRIDLCIDAEDDAYSKVLDILEMDKVSVTELHMYSIEGTLYQNLDWDSSNLLCELIENRVNMYIEISLDDMPGYLHVWLKKDAIVTVKEFTVEMLP